MNGVIPEENCIPMTEAIKGTCICGDIEEGTKNEINRTIDEGIFAIENGQTVTDMSEPPYHPYWQPAVLEVNKMPYMWNQMSEPARQKATKYMLQSGVPVISESYNRSSDFYHLYGGYENELATVLFYPVFGADAESAKTIVGSVSIELRWKDFMIGSFPPKSDLVTVGVENSCGQEYTLSIDTFNNALVVVSEGDLHEHRFDDMMQISTFEDFENVVNFAGTTAAGVKQSELEYCRYRFSVYPTEALESEYITNKPWIYAAMTVLIFLFTSLVFVVYDVIVRRRQEKVMASAKRTNAIVSQLFPHQVRDRLLDRAAGDANNTRKTMIPQAPKMILQSYLSDGTQADDSEPIADLFPHCTVMFADIAGFTAWSSERDPSQVFKLLESVYNAFDQAAKRLRIFKVETIGDCYVAAAGIPNVSTK